VKKILVAVDGSTAALHAARTALTLAQAMGAEVTLAFVTPPAYLPPEVPFSVVAMPEDTAKDAERLLESVVAALGQPKVQRASLNGTPAEAIADYADAGSFDLLVVGSKGRGAVARMLIGSVTDRLVHICRKPVLVVR
jgi:nucleotide-binding universal stress UspA family protein